MMAGTACWAATTWTSYQLGCEQPGGHSTARLVRMTGVWALAGI